ncbi:MAG: penicillin-binding protein 2 [Gammaproteobacteria bacterium]|nr:penicillin-binding protein 2 [Gammaproteobacteria bacterium]
MTRSQYKQPAGAWRLNLVYLVLFGCIVAIGWRVGFLHIVERDFLQGQGDARTIRIEPIIANRGIITDRNGEPLAVSTPVKAIVINPKEIIGDPDAIQVLADNLQLNAQVLANRVSANAHREFLYAKRRLPPAKADEILALGIAGVSAQQEYQRYYPQGEVAAHLLGFSNVDDVGQEGLELAYDDWLRGEPGKRRVMKDRRGNIIEELTILKTAQPGKNLKLSIDFRIQNLAYRELKSEFIARRAASATAVVLDVTSGEVLAMVNQPSYNPNNKSNLTDFSVLRNRAITDIFEPGSTIKAFTIAAALESGLYQSTTEVETRGWMMVGGHEVKDSVNYGVLTVEKIITKSSNVGATKIALRLGPEPIREVLAAVGFGEVTGSGFPGERGGFLPPIRSGWSSIETATLSFGYGLSSSALQLAQAYSVLASGGIRKPLTLLKLDASDIEELPSHRAISQEVADQVMAMLETVVDPKKGGTAVEANVPFYRVAGKTGTARVVGKNGYEEDVHNSLFVGVAPASKPKIVVVVVINEPKGDEHYGGQVAAPVFSRIVSGAMRILNVPPDKLADAELLSSGSP